MSPGVLGTKCTPEQPSLEMGTQRPREGSEDKGTRPGAPAPHPYRRQTRAARMAHTQRPQQGLGARGLHASDRPLPGVADSRRGVGRLTEQAPLPRDTCFRCLWGLFPP